MKEPTDGMEEIRRDERAVSFERGLLIRRLQMLGVNPIATQFNLTQFYWDLLRYAEKGGN